MSAEYLPSVVANPVSLHGFSQQSIPVSTSPVQTGDIEGGRYSFWCDEQTVYLKIAEVADDVTTGSGYPVFVGNMVDIVVPNGKRVGAVLATSSGTLRYHRVG